MRKLIAIVLALAVQTAECAAEDWELVKADNLGFQAEYHHSYVGVWLRGAVPKSCSGIA